MKYCEISRLTPANSYVKTRTAASTPFPKGFCWKFANGEFCGGCKFKHNCHKCCGSHRSSECTSTNFRTKPQRLLAARQTPRSQTRHPLCNPRPGTPVKVNRLQHYLSGYPFAKRQYLLNGLRMVSLSSAHFPNLVYSLLI